MYVKDLPTRNPLADLERSITAMIARGDFDAAESALGEAIGEAGGPALHQACAIPADAVRIEGWEAVAAEAAEAQRVFESLHRRHCAAVALHLLNRDSCPELRIERRYHSTAEPDPNLTGTPRRDAPYWQPEPGRTARVVVRGLEPLMRVQRAQAEDAPADAMLAGLVILLFYHQAIAQHLADPGLPIALTAFVGVEQQVRAAEGGPVDYGPQARRTIRAAPPRPAPPQAAVEAPVETPATPAVEDEDEDCTARTLTELREKRALLRHWPWWKDSSRRKAAIRMFEAEAREMFVAAMGEKSAPGWRTSDAVFDAALERFALHRGADPEEALAPPESNTRSERHLQFTSFALEYGGPRVMRHFLRSKGHRI